MRRAHVAISATHLMFNWGHGRGSNARHSTNRCCIFLAIARAEPKPCTRNNASANANSSGIPTWDGLKFCLTTLLTTGDAERADASISVTKIRTPPRATSGLIDLGDAFEAFAAAPTVRISARIERSACEKRDTSSVDHVLTCSRAIQTDDDAAAVISSGKLSEVTCE